MGKKIAIAVGAALAGVIALLLLVPALMDWHGAKDELAARISAALGRPVEITGPLHVGLLPVPRASVENVRIAGAPGGPDAATIPELRASLHLLPLLSGKVEVASLVLVRPEVHLPLPEPAPREPAHREAAPPPAGPQTASPQAVPPSAPSAPAEPHAPSRFNLDALDILGGALTYTPVGGGAPLRIDRIDAHISRESAGKIAAKGALRLDGVPLTVDVTLGPAASGQAGPLSATLATADDTARLTVAGTLAAGAEPRLDGRLTLAVPAPDKLTRPAHLPAWLAVPGPLSIEANVAADREQASLSNLQLSAGPLRAGGAITAAFGPKLQVDASLSSPNLDLDALAQAMPPPPAPATPAPPPAAPSPGGGTPSTSPQPAVGFSLPAAAFVNAELRAEAVTWHGQVAHQAYLQAILDQGELAVERAGLQLPGGAAVSAEGTLTAHQGTPAFDGRLTAKADDLHQALAWLGVDASGIPADRLHRFLLSMAVTAGSDSIALEHVEAGLDSTNASGRAAVSLAGPRPSVTVAVAADGLDLDSYLARHRPAQPSAPPAATQPPPAAAAPPAENPAVTAAPAVDGTLDLQVRHLVWLGTAAEDVSLSAALAGGELTLRQVQAVVAGTTVKAGGTLRYGRHRLHLDPLEVTWDGPHPGRMLATVAGDPEAVEVPAFDLHLGETRVKGAGRADLGGDRPRITATLAANVIDLDTFLGPRRSGELVPAFRFAAPPPPPSRGGMVPAAAGLPAGRAPFSTAPLNLAVLKAFDGVIDAKADALTWKRWRLEGATAHVVLDDGTASLDHLTGRLLGGTMDLALRLSGGTLPQLTGQLAVKGADVGKAGLGGGPIQVTAGRMTADARFSAAGRSTADMAARLGGAGRLAVEDGIVAGFDLPAVNRQLANKANLAGLLGAVQAGLAGGQTPFHALTATLQAENGVVSTHDAQLQAEGGSASGTATVDLPRWTLDSRIDIRLADGNWPPVGLRFEGPLDAPRKIIDINAIQRALVDQGVGRMLQEKGGQAPGQPAPSGKDLLKNFLHGLGGR